jgi:putative restriction endonuclease
MSDDRRMTTDRFYGGVSNRLANLRAMLEFIRAGRPARERVVQWVTDNTLAGSQDAVERHLAFLTSIEVVEFDDSIASPGRYGDAWLADQEPETLYRALNQGVKGFQTILESLCDRPMTDEEIMDLLVSEFDEAEMSTPGPAVRHREWLQVLGMVERADGVNQITAGGRELVDATDRPASAPVGRVGMQGEVSVGDGLSKETIEGVFDTGFGYQIAGINPRRDERDRRYVLVFANEDGPYNDSVTSGEFEYIGEGQTGDQSTSSPGNSTLIEAVDSEFPVYFFYKNRVGPTGSIRGWSTFEIGRSRSVMAETLSHSLFDIRPILKWVT